MVRRRISESQRSGADSGPPPPPNIGKNMILLAQNHDFSHEIPQKFRAPLLKLEKYDLLA